LQALLHPGALQGTCQREHGDGDGDGWESILGQPPSPPRRENTRSPKEKNQVNTGVLAIQPSKKSHRFCRGHP